MTSKKFFKTLFATLVTLCVFSFSTAAFADEQDIKAPSTDEEWDDILDDTDEDVGDFINPCVASYNRIILTTDSTSSIERVILLERY